MRLLIVRHGATDTDNAQKCWGHCDLELSELGLAQAERLRHSLATQPWDAVYTSTLKRAWQTAEILNRGRGVDLTRCAELREIDFGKVEGLTFEEISEHYPDVARLWAGGSLELAFPGGESIPDVDKRVDRFARRLSKQKPEATVLVVAHGGPLRLLLCHLLGIGVQHWWQFRFEHASLSVVESYPEGGMLLKLNDLSHLQAS